MSAVKLQKIGNSYGFRIPKDTLDHVGFRSEDDFEVIDVGGVLVILKRPPSPEKWVFREPGLTEEDARWVEADLGEQPARRGRPNRSIHKKGRR